MTVAVPASAEELPDATELVVVVTALDEELELPELELDAELEPPAKVPSMVRSCPAIFLKVILPVPAFTTISLPTSDAV